MHHHSLATVFLVSFATLQVGAFIGPQSDLHIVNKAIAPDGFQRVAVLAGSSPSSASFPGPLIIAGKGSNFRMNVVDALTDKTMLTSTSIHWHGMFQHTTNWADGPAFVTQCPITTGHSFMYDFTVPDQAGTYWYHSHLGVQYCDGLRGPLVIYDPEDPQRVLYDFDDESTVITLADWYHTPAPLLPAPSPSDSTLINGKGRWSGNPTAELAVINVQLGKRYRFRLISMSCDPNYIFSIDSHKLTIIEADGVSTKPRVVDSIQIFAAQRYSFVLNANQAIDNYWIRANPNFAVTTGFQNGINSAILRYELAKNADPITRAPVQNPVALAETDLHPFANGTAPGGAAPGQADVVLNLALGFDATKGRFLVNNVTYVNPTLPVLLQILSGAQRAQDLLPAGSVYTLPPDKVIEIRISGGNAPGGPHPFHLHGHVFSVVQSTGSAFNFANPVQRDVTAVAAGLDTVIRFVTDNPGPWLLHCHIDFHLETGLAIVLAEDPTHIKQVNPVPQAWKDLCPTYQSSGGGNPSANSKFNGR